MCFPTWLMMWVWKYCKDATDITVENTEFSDKYILSDIDLASIKVTLKIMSASNGSGNGLAPNRRHAITWTNADPVRWRIYAALGGDEQMVWGFYETTDGENVISVINRTATC